MLRKMFVLGFCLVIGFVLVAPAVGMGTAPGNKGTKALAQSYARVNPKAMQWGNIGIPASEKNLKGTPSPGGNNVQVLNDRNLIVVHPLPKPSVSSSNAEANYVQWAVDNVNPGGTVLLEMRDVKGVPRVFDFGGRTVIVTNNVNIVGSKESNIDAKDWTSTNTANKDIEIIENGQKMPPIRSDRAVVYNGVIQIGSQEFIYSGKEIIGITFSDPQPASVKSLRFEKSPTISIFVLSAVNMQINDNVITNVVPGVLWYHGFYELRSIVVVGAYGMLLGDTTIENNYVDLFGDNQANDPAVNWTDFSRADGINILGGSPKVSVKGNYIKNTPGAGILLDSLSSGSVTTVERNTIKLRQFSNIKDAYGITVLVGEGIVMEFHDNTAQTTIDSNTLEAIPGCGISLYEVPNALIKNNKIDKTLFNDKAWDMFVFGTYITCGIGIFGDYKGNTIENNTITGSSAYGIILDRDEFNVSPSNNIIKVPTNGLTGFNTVEASLMPPLSVWPYASSHIFLGPLTSSNEVNGTAGLSVLDYGTNNKINP